MAAATMGWQRMGKPDFSQAAKLFYRLPASLREGMNRSEEKVLIWTVFLAWTTQFHSGAQRTLASFSEAWLGTRFGRSRYTVIRALAKLEGFGLLTRIRRKPKRDGTFQTNCIALSTRMTSILAGVCTQVRDKSPCSKTATQEVKTEYKQERAATFSQSADPSLSPCIVDSGREKDKDRKPEEKQVEKGTLMRLYLELRGK